MLISGSVRSLLSFLKWKRLEWYTHTQSFTVHPTPEKLPSQKERSPSLPTIFKWQTVKPSGVFHGHQILFGHSTGTVTHSRRFFVAKQYLPSNSSPKRGEWRWSDSCTFWMVFLPAENPKKTLQVNITTKLGFTWPRCLEKRLMLQKSDSQPPGMVLKPCK